MCIGTFLLKAKLSPQQLDFSITVCAYGLTLEINTIQER